MGGGSSVGIINKAPANDHVKSAPAISNNVVCSENYPRHPPQLQDNIEDKNLPLSNRQKDIRTERIFEEEIAGADADADADADVEAAGNGSPRSEASAGVTELFAHTAMSLDMNNDDLLFNLLYFGDGNNANFGTVLNNAQQETIALHSENNTPYKLKPASDSTIAGMMIETFNLGEADMNELECAVCKDEIENECEILRIPACKHYFHKDCLLRWIKLQGWCPVCRAKIDSPPPATATTAKILKIASPLASAAEEDDEEFDEAAGNPLLSRQYCLERYHKDDEAYHVLRKGHQEDKDHNDPNDDEFRDRRISHRLLEDDDDDASLHDPVH